MSASTLTICHGVSPITCYVINRKSIFSTQDYFLIKEQKVTKLSYHNKENPLVYVPALLQLFSKFQNSNFAIMYLSFVILWPCSVPPSSRQILTLPV